MLLKTVRLHKYQVRFYLSLVKSKGPWKDAIEMTLKNGSDEDLEELIRQLRSEGSLAPKEMEEILGSEAYQKLIC